MSPLRALALLLPLVAACSDPDPPAPDPRFAALSDAILRDLDANPATAASVAVWLDGEVVWVGGFGHRDPDGDQPPGEATQFLIGSDTKKLAAISMLRAIAAGRTTLDTTVAEALPDLDMARAPAFPTATLRELLSHRGGLADGGELTTTTTDDALAAFANGELARDYPSLAPPGTFFNYSNPNFSIAGLIDQESSGRPWADLVEDDVLAPLGMTRTVARKDEVDADYAPGFGLELDQDSGSPHRLGLDHVWESAFVRPAGLVWSTPSDQMRLAAFLVDGNPAVLDAASLAELHAPQTPLYPDLPGAYGFGLFVGRGLRLGATYYDVPVWMHGGNTPGHTSTFYVLPDQRFAISILSNGDEDDFTASVVTAISTLVDLPAAGVAPAVPFDPAQLDGLTGTYVDPNLLGDMVVTRDGDALQLGVPMLDDAGIAYDHALTPVSTRVWLLSADGTVLDLAFIDGADGQAYLRSRVAVGVRAPAALVTRPPLPDATDVRRRVRASRYFAPSFKNVSWVLGAGRQP